MTNDPRTSARGEPALEMRELQHSVTTVEVKVAFAGFARA